MDAVIQKIAEAHQLLKDQVIQAVQNDQAIEQYLLDAIRSVYALLQALRQSNV